MDSDVDEIRPKPRYTSASELHGEYEVAAVTCLGGIDSVKLPALLIARYESVSVSELFSDYDTTDFEDQ